MKMSTNSNNPFNPFANLDLSQFDMTKMLSEYKLPGVDVNALVEAQCKNIEAVAAANKLAVESVQAIAKRQAEMLNESMAAVSNAAQEIAKAENPQDMTAKEAELARDALEKALANMRELAEMVGKSNTETFEVMNSRFKESLQELSSVMEAKKSETA
jgi:phasin family protein